MGILDATLSMPGWHATAGHAWDSIPRRTEIQNKLGLACSIAYLHALRDISVVLRERDKCSTSFLLVNRDSVIHFTQQKAPVVGSTSLRLDPHMSEFARDEKK